MDETIVGDATLLLKEVAYAGNATLHVNTADGEFAPGVGSLKKGEEVPVEIRVVETGEEFSAKASSSCPGSDHLDIKNLSALSPWRIFSRSLKEMRAPW